MRENQRFRKLTRRGGLGAAGTRHLVLPAAPHGLTRLGASAVAVRRRIFAGLADVAVIVSQQQSTAVGALVQARHVAVGVGVGGCRHRVLADGAVLGGGGCHVDGQNRAEEDQAGAQMGRHCLGESSRPERKAGRILEESVGFSLAGRKLWSSNRFGAGDAKRVS